MAGKVRTRRERRAVERKAKKAARRAGRRLRRSLDLLGVSTLIRKHLTDVLCATTFQEVRVTERRRLWTLAALAKFWVHVVLKSPGSLTEALEEAHREPTLLGSTVSGTPQAFFERSQSLNWRFFAELYRRFVASITPSARLSYATEFADLREHFTELWIVDGSRLDAVAHRLKLLWDVRSPMLPGCLIAFYDLFRGYPRILGFDPDAARAEMNRVREALPQVPRGTLLLGDRLYASVQLFEDAKVPGVWLLCRRNRQLTFSKIRRLGQRAVNAGVLDDWLVDAGKGATAPIQRLRYIRFKRAGAVYELFTNVLDPRKLPAETAMSLYPRRWTVERMFFSLKATLNLHEFYAANPNAVAMQVYAAAIVYTAMRIAQADVARQADIEPEAISPEKFFPRVAKACGTAAGIELGYRLTCLTNPGVRLKPPDPRGRPEFVVKLDEILVEKRGEKRRRRRYCKARRRWKSFAHVPGGKKLIC